MMRAESRRMSPAEYFAMKQQIVRQARAAQAAAIRAALASLIATAVSVAARPSVPLPKPEHGD
jgi:hypothetical protein